MVLEIRLARTLAFIAFMGTSDRIVAYVTCMDGWYMACMEFFVIFGGLTELDRWIKLKLIWIFWEKIIN
jgi:hypothetical protein